MLSRNFRSRSLSALVPRRDIRAVQTTLLSRRLHLQQGYQRAIRQVTSLNEAVGSRRPISHTATASLHPTPTSDLSLSPAQKQTIYALATPPGKAGVAVIRVSGPAVKDVYLQMVRPYGKSKRRGGSPEMPKPRLLERCDIIDPVNGEVLDDGMVVYFAGPKSFTTEDVLELQIHSGRAIITSILHSLSCIKGCRAAERGEFTRRAFEAGRLDLTQVEGLADLIDAETSAQRKLALRVAGGSVRARYEELRSQIIYCLAMVEAIIDFGEGEEIEDGVWEKAQTKVQTLRDDICRHLDDNRRGEILRSGIRLAIFGPPNAGKSSLLNYLAQRDAAIVTPLPGTTRDVLEVTLDIGGMPVVVADTAGLRRTSDVVESIGVERAKQTVEASDIALCVLSLPEILARQTVEPIPEAISRLTSPDTVFILNKSDLIDKSVNPDDIRALLPEGALLWVTSVSGNRGLDEFLRGFAGILRERFDPYQDNHEPLITHARHRTHLQTALGYLDAFLAYGAEDVVLAAEELRYAGQEVGKISGAIGVEDILDSVFKEFCIGK